MKATSQYSREYRERIKAEGYHALTVWLTSEVKAKVLGYPEPERRRWINETLSQAEHYADPYARIRELEAKLALAVTPGPQRTHRAAKSKDHTALLAEVVALRESGLVYSAIASRFNAEGRPTLSGSGLWSGGTLAAFVRYEQGKL